MFFTPLFEDIEMKFLKEQDTTFEDREKRIQAFKDRKAQEEEEVVEEPAKVEEKPVPASPESGDKMGVAGSINSLIRDEWEAIDGYNSTISTIRYMKDSGDADPSIDYDGIIKILEDIANEENLHVGQLQKALETISPNAASIGEGEQEAEEQLVEALDVIKKYILKK